MLKQHLKHFCLVILLSISTLITSGQQNVGIGTNTPTELLDVNGNLNVNGQIKLNGNAGQPGEMLMTGSDGNPFWGIAREFNTFVGTYIFNSTVSIPATVNKVMIEVWGAGGGGAQAGGGASGNYAMGVYSISGSTTLTLTVGEGGTGAATYTEAAANGGNTNVTGTGINILTTGGRGANQYYPDLTPSNGGTGASVTGAARLQSAGLAGENGHPTSYQTFPVSATEWHIAVQFGRGGHASMGIGIGGPGGFRVHNSTVAPDSIFYIKLYQGGFCGIAAGGGGGQRLGSGWGGAGGRGYVIIRY